MHFPRYKKCSEILSRYYQSNCKLYQYLFTKNIKMENFRVIFILFICFASVSLGQNSNNDYYEKWGYATWFGFCCYWGRDKSRVLSSSSRYADNFLLLIKFLKLKLAIRKLPKAKLYCRREKRCSYVLVALFKARQQSTSDHLATSEFLSLILMIVWGKLLILLRVVRALQALALAISKRLGQSFKMALIEQPLGCVYRILYAHNQSFFQH